MTYHLSHFPAGIQANDLRPFTTAELDAAGLPLSDFNPNDILLIDVYLTLKGIVPRKNTNVYVSNTVLMISTYFIPTALVFTTGDGYLLCKRRC